MIPTRNFHSHRNIAAILFAAMFFLCCSTNEQEDLGEKVVDFPSRTITNAQLIRREFGRLRIELNAPIIEEYGFIDTTYTLFKEGVDLEYYKSKNTSPGYLKADWAKLSDASGIYEARGNVVMINPKGDTLRSQTLVWDTKKKTVETKDTVYLRRANGEKLTARNGMTGTDDFKNYTFYNNNGLFKLNKDGDL